MIKEIKQKDMVIGRSYLDTVENPSKFILKRIGKRLLVFEVVYDTKYRLQVGEITSFSRRLSNNHDYAPWYEEVSE